MKAIFTPVLIVFLLLGACASEPARQDNKKYLISNGFIQEAIDLNLNVSVKTKWYKELIRLLGYDDEHFIAEDCEGQILKINKQDIVKAWEEESDNICNNDFSGLSKEPESSAPIAEIDLYASTIHEVVMLDGSDSFNPRGGELTFQWKFLSIPPESFSEIDHLSSPKPKFIPDAYGEYIIELVVKNENGITSPPNTVTYSPKHPYHEEFKGIGEDILKLLVVVLFFSFL